MGLNWRSGRLSATVRAGNLLDLLERHRFGCQQTNHKGNTARRAAIAVAPTPHRPRADGK
jgi:hypothetical protein